jgi:ribosomal protein S18 acetylase RimI-like enzyme
MWCPPKGLGLGWVELGRCSPDLFPRGLAGYVERMQCGSSEIIRCPPPRVAEAISLVLSDLAPSQRCEIVGELSDVTDSARFSGEPIFIALFGERLCGAVWAQRQPGRSAVLWPPQLVSGEPAETAKHLIAAATKSLDAAGVEMSQALLRSSDTGMAPVLTEAGYIHVADLLYLACDADRFPNAPPAANDLEFVAYDASQRGRLVALVERTYESTLDCPALNGRRRMDDVVDGYQATGEFRAEYWQIVRSNGLDVGVLLLADHPSAGHWELMYMGIAPEGRGRGWGLKIARHAQWLARRAGVGRIVLAVDAANWPAAAMYARAGFERWDRRSAFVRFLR